MMWKPNPAKPQEFLVATEVISAALWQIMNDNDEIHPVIVGYGAAADTRVRQLLDALDLDTRERIVDRVSEQWTLMLLTSKSILALAHADQEANRDIQSIWPDFKMGAQ